MKVAVIGAGISGLSAAYTLCKAGADVTVYERNNWLGGNAKTTSVALGDAQRWIDLGVNDFNSAAYIELTKTLNELGVEYRPINNTISYSSQDGSIAYTLDGKLGTTMPPTLAAELQKFERIGISAVTDRKYTFATVSEFLRDHGFTREFAFHHLYARINGMWFTDPLAVTDMPIRLIMHYYVLQQGYNAKGPPRRASMYFVGGTQRWVDKLRQSTPAKFKLSVAAEINPSSTGVTVHAGNEKESYDRVVLACQADEALRSFRSGLTSDILQILGSFRYNDSILIAHTYSGVMPVNVNAWRTYNIVVHPDAENLITYSISFFVNRHINEVAGQAGNMLDQGLCFVTANPVVPIPDRYVLRSPDGQKAVAVFRHCIMNMRASIAQGRLASIQGVNNVYYAGGYTKGIGLHEECWISGQDAARAVIAGRYDEENQYDYSGRRPEYAPAYIRRSLN